jgi:hypothetical protein
VRAPAAGSCTPPHAHAAPPPCVPVTCDMCVWQVPGPG